MALFLILKDFNRQMRYMESQMSDPLSVAMDSDDLLSTFKQCDHISSQDERRTERSNGERVSHEPAKPGP